MRVVILTLLFTFLYTPLAAAQELNAGIVQGLWYSQEKVFAGEAVRIYVAIRNNTGSDLSGTVEFYDNNVRLTRKTVQALDGRIIESWADWKPTYGEHELSATLTRIELSKVGEETQEIEMTSALAEDTLFIDYDTDTDGVGNKDDTDDDGDGMSDAQEKENGTDPLVKDKPKIEEGNEEDSDDTEQVQEASKDNAKESAQGPQGIERYLTDSPAENMLANVTTYITEVKQDLDAYREERKEEQLKIESQTSSESASSTNGFGEVVRSTETKPDTVWTHDFSLMDFIRSLWALIVTLFDAVYTFLLAMLSWLLGHPILVQLGLLALILLILIKFAHKFGRRPKPKKL